MSQRRRSRTPVNQQHRRVQSPFPPPNSYQSPGETSLDLLGDSFDLHSPDFRMNAPAEDIVRLNLGIDDHALNKNGVVAFVVRGVTTTNSDGARSVQDVVIFLYPVSDVILASTQSGLGAFKAMLLEDGTGFTLVHPGRKPFELHQGRGWRNFDTAVLSGLPAGFDRQQAELQLQLALQAGSASGEMRDIQIPNSDEARESVEVPLDKTTFLFPPDVTCNNEFFNRSPENELTLSIDMKVASSFRHPNLAESLFRSTLAQLRGASGAITEDMAAQAFRTCLLQLNAAKPQAMAYVRIMMAIDKTSNSCIGAKKPDHATVIAEDDFYGLNEGFERMNMSDNQSGASVPPAASEPAPRKKPKKRKPDSNLEEEGVKAGASKTE